MIKEAGADQAVLTLKSLEAFTKAADGRATKIIIPSEIQSVAGLVKSVTGDRKRYGCEGMRLTLDPSLEYGVVLEGGGARGAYQIGALKAVTEAGIRIGAVAGASVGALNGAFLCMGDLKAAEELWGNLAYSQILNVEDETIRAIKTLGLKASTVPQLMAEARKVVSGRGLDITPFKELLEKYVDEEKIRSSPCDLYVTSLSVTDRREVVFDVKQAPSGTIKDVLLASAFFPAFKNEKLGGKTYLDGGMVNNVPVDVLAERGYKNLIVIRIYGIGVDTERRTELSEDVNVYRIAPRRNLGGILEFEKKKTRRNMTLGYFDARRLLCGLAQKVLFLSAPYRGLLFQPPYDRNPDLPPLFFRPSGAWGGRGDLWLPDVYGASISLPGRKIQAEARLGLQGALRGGPGGLRQIHGSGGV